MKLTKADIEQNEYKVFVVHAGKPRFVRLPVEIDSDMRRVTYNVIGATEKVKLLEVRPVVTTVSEENLEELELEERDFVGPFFIVDRKNQKILEVV